jgi:hypothetical protein
MYLSEQKIQGLTDGAVNDIMTALYGSRWSSNNNVTEDKELMDMSDAIDGSIYALIEKANNSKFQDDVIAALRKSGVKANLECFLEFANGLAGLKTPDEIVEEFIKELN